MYKYERITKSLKKLINEGSLNAHERLPSLRDQVELTGLSLMTVLNAYQELESQGLIYSIEKSGYFVSPNQHYFDQLSEEGIHLNRKIEINSFVFEYLKSIQSDEMVQLGSPFPSHELLNPPKLLQIMRTLTRDKLMDHQSNLPPGNEALRKLIAQRYTMQGVPTKSDDIVITSGCLDALNLSLQALTKAGDYILLQQTLFYGAWQIAEKLGLNVVTIPDDPHDGFNIDAFERAIETYPIKVCWFMLNCHNPIGFTVRQEIKERIAKILHEHHIHLIEDDVYEELYYHGEHPAPMKRFDKENLVLHCSSFSKVLGANFRIGWVHAGHFSEKIQHLQMMSTISANALLQNALVQFISNHHYERHLRTLRRRLYKNKQQFYHYLCQNLPDECEVKNYDSGYFLWLKLPKKVSSMKIYQTLLKNNISVSPNELFNIQDVEHNHVRLNCSFEWSDRYKNALDCLINNCK